MDKKITASDNLQKKYTYTLSEKQGENFHPDFNPDLSPKQMMKLGIFCGKYFESVPEEFPKEWFKGVKIAEDERDCTINYFKEDASQPLGVWQEKGWIHKDDPHGWFQWYCRYYLGRRHEDDHRQIKRWHGIRRHAGAIVKNCREGDLGCRPKQRQALLHWAYDSRNI